MSKPRLSQVMLGEAPRQTVPKSAEIMHSRGVFVLSSLPGIFLPTLPGIFLAWLAPFGGLR